MIIIQLLFVRCVYRDFCVLELLSCVANFNCEDCETVFLFGCNAPRDWDNRCARVKMHLCSWYLIMQEKRVGKCNPAILLG